MTDLHRLAELAREELQWPWYEEGSERFVSSFIAACDPQTILELIERVEKAEGSTAGAAKAMTHAQIVKASRDAQIAYCLDKFSDYETALVREVERAHGIGPATGGGGE